MSELCRVAIIPARGGSKRIPRKNIREFCGKPMIAWTIEAAQASGCFERIIVTTDDESIADTASARGAEVPFLRPADLSDDYTGTLPVIHHAVDWLIKDGCPVDYACCLYATAPFLSPEAIQQGWMEIQKSHASYAFSVTSFAFPIQRAIRVTPEGRVTMFYPEHFNSRSQDLEEAWHDAGQFYWGTAQAWMEERPLFTEESVPVKLPRHRVQDIDTPEDWRRAELMFDALHRSGGAA
jgi:pseudaminic acid cytidylyltransferase